MGHKNLLIGLIAALLLFWGASAIWAQSSCPPLPTCTSTGSLSDLSGTFVCTEIQISSNGVAGTGILSVTSAGDGTLSTVLMARNSNNSSETTTYHDFSSQGSATYCLNIDDTGYVFPSNGCPLALVIDNGKTEIRLLDSTENNAQAVVCTLR